jgi:hypothetical protein
MTERNIADERKNNLIEFDHELIETALLYDWRALPSDVGRNGLFLPSCQDNFFAEHN